MNLKIVVPAGKDVVLLYKYDPTLKGNSMSYGYKTRLNREKNYIFYRFSKPLHQDFLTLF